MDYQPSLFIEENEADRKSRIFGTKEFDQAYKKYINSTPWKKITRQVKERSQAKCERCRCRPKRLEVHHKTYDNFRNEPLTDLEALCPNCHLVADKEREWENRRKFDELCEESKYDNARKTYFSKKYGEEWLIDYFHRGEEMEVEFSEWHLNKQMEY